MSDSEEQFAYAMQLVASISLPMVLLNATKLKVFDTIAKGGPNVGLSAHEIASHLSISNQNAPEMLDRMLRFKVEEALLEGGTPFDKVHGSDGKSGFEYMGLDARFNKIFNKAMVDTSIIVIKEVLNFYHGFDNLKSLVDIGGGLGITLNMIISKHPKIKGINLDLPRVIQHAPQYPGIEHVGGDMFQNLPQGEAIFMKCVLHGWSDNNCIKLLKNCYKSLPEHGKVIVVDKILPVLPDTSSYAKCGNNQDTIMMTQTPGGKERTEDEFLALRVLDLVV
nr:caffeic acid 3-O-methyltransferase-like [Tanacetum cinerariifolium]